MLMMPFTDLPIKTCQELSILDVDLLLETNLHLKICFLQVFKLLKIALS